MPYLYVEFKVNPPIREAIGKVPDDIVLLENNGVMQVLLGEERTEEIKKSDRFKKILEESEKKRKHSINPEEDQTLKSKNDINQLEAELMAYGTQKANDFINQFNFMLNSSTYEVQLTTLAILCLKRHLHVGVSGYVKSDLKTDIYEINDKDNLFRRMLSSYCNGLKAKKYEDYINAYKCFYYVFPDYSITSDKKENLKLKLLRHGGSHIILKDKNLMEAAKELLGPEYVKKDEKGNEYTYIDPSIHKGIYLEDSY